MNHYQLLGLENVSGQLQNNFISVFSFQPDTWSSCYSRDSSKVLLVYTYWILLYTPLSINSLCSLILFYFYYRGSVSTTRKNMWDDMNLDLNADTACVCWFWFCWLLLSSTVRPSSRAYLYCVMTCDCGCAIEGTHTTYIYICVCTPIHPFSVDDAVNSEAGREGERERRRGKRGKKTHPS